MKPIKDKGGMVDETLLYDQPSAPVICDHCGSKLDLRGGDAEEKTTELASGLVQRDTESPVERTSDLPEEIGSDKAEG